MKKFSDFKNKLKIKRIINDMNKFCVIREPDYVRAKAFYDERKADIQDLTFEFQMLSFDEILPIELVKDGVLVKSPLEIEDFKGITESAYGVPVLVVKYKDGNTEELECYKCWQRNRYTGEEKFEICNGTSIKTSCFDKFYREIYEEDCKLAFRSMIRFKMLESFNNRMDEFNEFHEEVKNDNK